MKRRLRVLLVLGAVVVVFLATTSSVTATPIYSQTSPVEPVGAFSSRDTTAGQKIADNFILAGPSPITVRSVRLIGGYGNTNPPPLNIPFDDLPDDDFRVVFLEDFGGSPGTPIVGGDFASNSVVHREPTNGRLLNGVYTPVEITINLEEGITLSPGTEYWVSITHNLGPDHGWLWARAQGVLDQQIASKKNIIAAPWEVFTSGGMWFELGDQNIPEPNTVTMLMVALALALSICRNRRVLSQN